MKKWEALLFSFFKAEPRHVVLVHGESQKMDFLRDKIKEEFGQIHKFQSDFSRSPVMVILYWSSITTERTNVPGEIWLCLIEPGSTFLETETKTTAHCTKGNRITEVEDTGINYAKAWEFRIFRQIYQLKSAHIDYAAFSCRYWLF